MQPPPLTATSSALIRSKEDNTQKRIAQSLEGTVLIYRLGTQWVGAMQVGLHIAIFTSIIKYVGHHKTLLIMCRIALLHTQHCVAKSLF